MRTVRSGHAGQSHLHLNVLCFSQGGQAELLQKEELQSGVDAANTAAQEYQRSKSHFNCVSPEVLSRGGECLCVMEGPKSRFCHSSTHPKPISHSQLPGTFGGSRSSPVLKVEPESVQAHSGSKHVLTWLVRASLVARW